MASDKERVDVLLVDQGFFETREKAKASIMAGLIFVDEERIEKPGTKMSRLVKFVVKGAPHPYVSRGGLKLEKALKYFAISLEGLLMLDIGASTGGFTDCALKQGVAGVVAIDVGYNQLDWSLRIDPRVTVMERTNFRYMKPEDLPSPAANFATIDVSFISLQLILPPLQTVLAPGGELIALVKPQFEAGRANVGKSGVVRDSQIHRNVLMSILTFAANLGFGLKGLTYSPITGGEGNIEFLAYWTINGNLTTELTQIIEPHQWVHLIEDIVNEASHTLK